MLVREARLEDLDSIMRVYCKAKEYMNNNGNPTQWRDGYPQRELLENDIRCRQCYVVCSSDKEVHAVFVLMFGADPTYTIIEEGSWKNEEPYGTIHRLAGDGAVKGVTSKCIEFCKEKTTNLRADTHHDNKIMQYLLEKNDFERCGIIYVGDGSPRIAYQYSGN